MKKISITKLFKIINTLYINIIFKSFDYEQSKFQDEYNIEIKTKNFKKVENLKRIEIKKNDNLIFYPLNLPDKIHRN